MVIRDAVNFFEESLALYRSLSGAERQRAVCPFNIGALSVRLGYYREAAVSYDESADLFHRIPGGQRDASDLRTPLTPQTGWVRVGDVLAHRLQRAALRQDPAAVGRRIVVLGRGVPRAGPAAGRSLIPAGVSATGRLWWMTWRRDSPTARMTQDATHRHCPVAPRLR